MCVLISLAMLTFVATERGGHFLGCSVLVRFLTIGCLPLQPLIEGHESRCLIEFRTEIWMC